MSDTSPILIKYGKASGPLLSHKQSFLTDNDKLMREQQGVCALYAEQPPRSACKNCDAPLSGESDFVKQGVGYAFCTSCGHLNGLHDDTPEFCHAVYSDDDGEDYARNYAAQDQAQYDKRVSDIYVPKAEFLSEVLVKSGLNPTETKVSDFGAGSGYMVKALRQVGFQKALGYEVSKSQVDLGNHMIGEETLQLHTIGNTITLAEQTDAQVITMIGVLEHVINPREILRAFQNNSSIEYLMISVPLFSPCIFFEMVFDDVLNRQLTAGHTHLYTEGSIDYLCGEFGFARHGEWWFGTDMVDLFRSVSVRLEKNQNTKAMTERWGKTLLPILDDMQMQMDQKNLSSEVHLVLKKRF